MKGEDSIECSEVWEYDGEKAVKLLAYFINGHPIHCADGIAVNTIKMPRSGILSHFRDSAELERIKQALARK